MVYIYCIYLCYVASTANSKTVFIKQGAPNPCHFVTAEHKLSCATKQAHGQAAVGRSLRTGLKISGSPYLPLSLSSSGKPTCLAKPYHTESSPCRYWQVYGHHTRLKYQTVLLPTKRGVTVVKNILLQAERRGIKEKKHQSEKYHARPRNWLSSTQRKAVNINVGTC